jgi:hypothetical protein
MDRFHELAAFIMVVEWGVFPLQRAGLMIRNLD